MLIAVIVIAAIAVGAAVVITKSGDDTGNGGIASACTDVGRAFGPEGMATLQSAMTDLSSLESMGPEDISVDAFQNAADSIDVLADTVEPFATLLAELDASKEFNAADPNSDIHDMSGVMKDAVSKLREIATTFRGLKTIDDLATSVERFTALGEEMNSVGESLNSFSSSPAADKFLMDIPECSAMIDTLNSL